MKEFFKYVLATLVGLLLFLVVSFAGFVLLISTLLPQEDMMVTENSVLKLDLNKQIIDRESGNIFAQLNDPFNNFSMRTVGLLELRQAIKNAAINNNIKGIYLSVGNVQAGLATLQELRQELERFKKSGKFIVAFGSMYTEESYYVSSVADRIYLPPTGMLEFNGLHVELLFFKKLLEKLEIEPHVFKVGEYKSAVEPFISESMSVANREQLNALLNSIYTSMLTDISASRKIQIPELKHMSDSMLVRNAEDAKQYNLVTHLGYYNDAVIFMKKSAAVPEDQELKFVRYSTLLGNDLQQTEAEGNKVAVIFALGDIIDGEGDERTIGSETLSKEIRKAREDDNIKAVVLRVNSPGGSALASDVIWKEVQLTAKEKPVIASMSDLAASGGYYISAACDTILAHPATITGSIGVFGVLFNGKKFLNEKLGITTDKEQTGPYADLGSFTRDLKPYEKEIIQEEVEEIYKTFIGVVAQGRDLDSAYVRSVAQGRVWSGVQAVDRKLTDGYGGLNEAILLAAGRAGVENDFETVYLPEREALLFQELLAALMGGENSHQSGMAVDIEMYLAEIKRIAKIEGVQARLPYQLLFD